MELVVDQVGAWVVCMWGVLVMINVVFVVVAAVLGALWRKMGLRRIVCPLSAPLKISISATSNPCGVFGVKGSTAIDPVVVKWTIVLTGT